VATPRKCAACKKILKLYPPGEPVTETKMKRVPNPDFDPDIDPREFVDVPYEIVHIMTVRQQSPFDGKINHIPTDLKKYSEEPAIIVNLDIGIESITRAYCTKCYTDYIEGPAEHLFTVMEAFNKESER